MYTMYRPLAPNGLLQQSDFDKYRQLPLNRQTFLMCNQLLPPFFLKLTPVSIFSIVLTHNYRTALPLRRATKPRMAVVKTAINPGRVPKQFFFFISFNKFD